MDRYRAIILATALEMLSEPVSLLILLFSASLAVLAPAFHYHQFGEAARMARDAGVSSLFLGGSAFAVFSTIRAFRREVESGTLEMALSHPISRGTFFLSKAAGCVLAYLLYALILGAVTVVMVNGAEIGGSIAERSGDIARVWGPSLAIGVAVLLLPLLTAAMLNRFAGCRFVVSAFGLATCVASIGMAYRFSGEIFLRLLPVLLLAMVPTFVLLLAAAVAAVRFRANAAASASGVVFVALMPFVGNYYLPDALSGGGTLPWSYVSIGVLAAIPALAALLLLGAVLMNGMERG